MLFFGNPFFYVWSIHFTYMKFVYYFLEGVSVVL